MLSLQTFHIMWIVESTQIGGIGKIEDVDDAKFLTDNLIYGIGSAIWVISLWLLKQVKFFCGFFRSRDKNNSVY